MAINGTLKIYHLVFNQEKKLHSLPIFGLTTFSPTFFFPGTSKSSNNIWH